MDGMIASGRCPGSSVQPFTCSQNAHAHTHGNLWKKENDSPAVPVDAAFQTTKTCPAGAQLVFLFFKKKGPPPFLPTQKSREKKQSVKDITAPVFRSYLSLQPVIKCRGRNKKDKEEEAEWKGRMNGWWGIQGGLCFYLPRRRACQRHTARPDAAQGSKNTGRVWFWMTCFSVSPPQ